MRVASPSIGITAVPSCRVDVETWPAAQPEQTLTFVASLTVLNWPLGQLSQLMSPCSLNVPAGQLLQWVAAVDTPMPTGAPMSTAAMLALATSLHQHSRR